MLAVCLEEASRAQLVEWPQGHTRGIPEPHGAILVAVRKATSGPAQVPVHPPFHASSDHSLSTYNICHALITCTQQTGGIYCTRVECLLCARPHAFGPLKQGEKVWK